MKTRTAYSFGYGSVEEKKERLRAERALFLLKFPTRADCINELVDIGDGSHHCKNCGSANFHVAAGDRKAKCLECNTMNWFLSGTFFERVKRPDAWLFAIWLLERGLLFNAKDLEEVAKIRYDPASKILKKLSFVIRDNMRSHPQVMEAPSKLFSQIIFRRSLKTPAGMHPKAEEQAMQQEAAAEESGREQKNTDTASEYTTDRNFKERTAKKETAGFPELSNIELKIFQAMSEDPLSFDDLSEKLQLPIVQLSAILGLMEIKSLIEKISGDRYVKSQNYAFAKGNSKLASTLQIDDVYHDSHNTDQDNSNSAEDLDERIFKAIRKAKDFITECCQGIARKYLELYIAIYWCFYDRGRWGIKKLLAACKQFRKVHSHEIRACNASLKIPIICL